MGDPIFKKQAREHQIDFFKDKGIDAICPKAFRGYDVKGMLKAEDANKGVIFYEGYRRQILAELEKDDVKFSSMMKCHTLRSEHIPWNLFFPMTFDANSQIALSVFNEIVESKFGTKDFIRKIDAILIEYSPKPINNYLNDHTAFDTYVAYTASDGGKGAIGIEVKYTEEGYNIGKQEEDRIYGKTEKGRNECKYYEVMNNQEIGYYQESHASWNSLSEPWSALIKDDLRQIWRNHLLGASMVLNEDINHFLSLHLYPNGNTHFSGVNGAVAKYQQFLSDKGRSTWEPITFEKMFAMMAKYAESDESKKWIDYLYQRYIFD